MFGPVSDVNYAGPKDLARTAGAVGATIDLPTGLLRQDVRPDAAAVRTRAGGLISENPWSGLSDVIRRQENVRVTETLRLLALDVSQLREGISAAQLVLLEEEALAHTRVDNPVVLFRGEGTALAVDVLTPQVLVGIEDKRTPGCLKVRKLVDRLFATTGDTVTFTIELANTGQKPLTDVVVIDNLTPRLAYVPGSASSTLAGRAEVTPNGEGSSIVKFILDEPLAGGQSGAVTFETVVR